MPRIKQFCPQGHDTFIVGRRGHTGYCNECMKVSREIEKSNRKARRRLKGNFKGDPVSLTKLLEFKEQHGLTYQQLSELIGIEKSQLRRYAIGQDRVGLTNQRKIVGAIAGIQRKKRALWLA